MSEDRISRKTVFINMLIVVLLFPSILLAQSSIAPGGLGGYQPPTGNSSSIAPGGLGGYQPPTSNRSSSSAMKKYENKVKKMKLSELETEKTTVESSITTNKQATETATQEYQTAYTGYQTAYANYNASKTSANKAALDTARKALNAAKKKIENLDNQQKKLKQQLSKINKYYNSKKAESVLAGLNLEFSDGGKISTKNLISAVVKLSKNLSDTSALQAQITTLNDALDKVKGYDIVIGTVKYNSTALNKKGISLVKIENSTETVVAITQTDDQGGFAFTGVLDGTYIIKADLDDQGTAISVKSSEITVGTDTLVLAEEVTLTQ